MALQRWCLHRCTNMLNVQETHVQSSQHRKYYFSTLLPCESLYKLPPSCQPWTSLSSTSPAKWAHTSLAGFESVHMVHQLGHKKNKRWWWWLQVLMEARTCSPRPCNTMDRQRDLILELWVCQRNYMIPWQQFKSDSKENQGMIDRSYSTYVWLTKIECD